MNAFLDDMVQSTGEKAGELSPMVLLLAAEGALSPSARVWGTGGWLQPEDREALDWLTLVRFLGWEVEVCVVDRGGELATRLPAHARVIIIACDPDTLNNHSIGRDLLVSLDRTSPAHQPRGGSRQRVGETGRRIDQWRFRRRAINRVARARPTPDLDFQESLRGRAGYQSTATR